MARACDRHERVPGQMTLARSFFQPSRTFQKIQHPLGPSPLSLC